MVLESVKVGRSPLSSRKSYKPGECPAFVVVMNYWLFFHGSFKDFTQPGQALC